MDKTKIKQVTKFDGEYTGAMSGFIDLKESAEQILGKVHPGNVFIYMFRRFGYPISGWDDQKTLVKYNITTPMDGVVLTVSPNVTGAGTFRYLLREDLDRSCVDELDLSYREWHDKFNAWAIKEHNTEIIKMLERDTERIQRVWNIWAADKEDKDFKDQKEINRAFLKDQEDIRVKLTKEYKEIEPFPKRIPSRDRDDSSIIKQCHNALCDAIEDLKRPVYVRDVMFNITGRVEYIDLGKDYITKNLNMAGIGVGDKFDADIVSDKNDC